MVERSSDFERFLYANYPDDYRRATVENVPDDILTAIISRHASHYSVWCNIPEWIKNQYNDRLPSEVLNGNMTPRDFVVKEENKLSEEEKENKALLDFSVTMLALGYAAETTEILAANKATRAQIFKEANGGPLSADLLARLLATRESDKRAITKDWKENQPEKYLLHLVKELSRAQKRVDRAENEADAAAAGMKISATERELLSYIGGLKDKASKQRMVDYLRQKPQQAALSHLSPDVLERFTELLEQQGIQLSPVQSRAKAMTNENKRGNLFNNLKQNFMNQQKEEALLAQSYNRQNISFTRVKPRDMFGLEKDDSVDKIMSLRQENLKQKGA